MNWFARTTGDETLIKFGLKPGETVVTDGHLRLTPGVRVSVKSDGSRSDAQKTEP